MPKVGIEPTRSEGLGTRGPTMTSLCGGPAEGANCMAVAGVNTSSNVFVATESADGTGVENHGFYIAGF